MLEHHQPSMHSLEHKIKRQISVSHWDNRINGIRITAAHQIAQLLIDRIHHATIVIFGGRLFDPRRNQVTDASEFHMSISIRGSICEYHFPTFEHSTL